MENIEIQPGFGDYDRYADVLAWYEFEGQSSYWEVTVSEQDGQWYVSKRNGPFAPCSLDKSC